MPQSQRIYPTDIVLTPSSVSIREDTAVGIALCSFVVLMSRRNVEFSGIAAVDDPRLHVVGNSVVLSRALDLADHGSHFATVSAVQNSVRVQSTLTWAVLDVPTPLPIITFDPPNPAIPSTTPVGTKVATVIVRMDDGSNFNGTIGFGEPHYNDGGRFVLSGYDLIINPNGPGLPESGTISNCSVVAWP